MAVDGNGSSNPQTNAVSIEQADAQETTGPTQNKAASSSSCKSAPLVGHRGPGFEAIAVVDQDFQKIRLADYLGRYVILFFYPLDFTFVCPTEVAAFSDRYDEFQALDTEILGISVDSQYAHLAWIQTERKLGGVGDIRYPLVSDLTKAISTAYAVLNAQEGVALRGLFILDPAGVVQHATVNNLAFGRSVDDTLRTLRAIQQVQRHRNQVCPVDWQPGDATLLEEPGQVQAYFAQTAQVDAKPGVDGE